MSEQQDFESSARALLMHAVGPILQNCANSYINAWTEQWLVRAKALGAYHGRTVGRLQEVEQEWEAWTDQHGLPKLEARPENDPWYETDQQTIRLIDAVVQDAQTNPPHRMALEIVPQTAPICWVCGRPGNESQAPCDLCVAGSRSSKERPWLVKCPKCGLRCGSRRAGAEFEHQFLCWSCWHVWIPR